jgi:hypothetical protein
MYATCRTRTGSSAICAGPGPHHHVVGPQHHRRGRRSNRCSSGLNAPRCTGLRGPLQPSSGCAAAASRPASAWSPQAGAQRLSERTRGASVSKPRAATRASSAVRSPKGGDAVVDESRSGTIRTQDPCRVLIRPTSARYLRDISSQSPRAAEPGLMQGFSREFECSARLCENRGVPGSSPDLAVLPEISTAAGVLATGWLPRRGSAEPYRETSGRRSLK